MLVVVIECEGGRASLRMEMEVYRMLRRWCGVEPRFNASRLANVARRRRIGDVVTSLEVGLGRLILKTREAEYFGFRDTELVNEDVHACSIEKPTTFETELL